MKRFIFIIKCLFWGVTGSYDFNICFDISGYLSIGDVLIIGGDNNRYIYLGHGKVKNADKLGYKITV